MDKDLIAMLQQTGPESPAVMEKAIRLIKEKGASVGMEDVVNYSIASYSGHAATGAQALGKINILMRDIYLEAIETLGEKVVYSKKSGDLAKMQQFIKKSKKYKMLMTELKTLPRYLVSKVKLPAIHPRANFPTARYVRKQISLPYKACNNPVKYADSVVKQLNGKVKRFQRLGRGATWYVPAILGAYNVAQAPPGLRLRTFFEEGFGILGGAAGTALGLYFASFLCFGPFGLFIASFICASAAGIIGMKGGNLFGGDLIYDTGSKIFHSHENLLEEVLR